MVVDMVKPWVSGVILEKNTLLIVIVSRLIAYVWGYES